MGINYHAWVQLSVHLQVFSFNLLQPTILGQTHLQRS